MNYSTLSIRFIALFLCCLTAYPSYAQLEVKADVGHPSASVSDFTRYGKYDAQIYSGKVSVSIPLCTLHDEDFTIPVSLDYSYNGFVPNSQAGEVGLGWTLSCGGFITREVRGLPDEGFTYIDLQSTQNADLYGFDFMPQADKMEYLDHDVRYQYLEDDTSPETILRTYIFGVNTTYYDGSPDIYHFTFLGRTGSFVIDNATGLFKAYNTSTFDGDYKIEKTVYNTYHGGFLYPSSFTITTSDGYHYVFGDASGSNYDVYTERSTLLRHNSPSTDQIQKYNYPAHAWALRKIVAPNGREVLFRYNGYRDNGGASESNEGKDGILDFTNTLYSMSPALWGGGISATGIWSAQSSMQPHEQLVSKCLLTSIESDSFELYFHYEDKLPEQISLCNKSGTAARLTEGYLPMLTRISDMNSVTVARLYYTYNRRGNPYPFLTKASLPGQGDYSFDYKDITTNYLPPMGTTAIDHWGYLRSTDSSACNIFTFNANSVGLQNSSYDETLPQGRDANFNAFSVGLMTRVGYPTSGYSRFFWEQNSYRVALVKTSSNSFVPRLDTLQQTQNGPGARICKIVNYDTDGTAIDSTQYHYQNSNGTASGVLLRTPRYSIAYNGTFRNNNYSFYYVTTGGIASFDAVPVEYPEVEELLNDSSRIVHHFSSYATHPDLFATNRAAISRHIGTGTVSYLNMGQVSVTDAAVVSNILRPTMSRQIVRGRDLRRIWLDAQSDTVKTEQTSLLASNVSFPHFIYVGEAVSDAGIYVGGCQPFTSVSTDYLDDASRISSSTEYGYNDNGQTTQVCQTLSNGDELITIYRYPADMINDPLGNTIYNQMIADNVIGYPVETEQRIRKSGESSPTVLSKERYTFSRFSVAGDTLHFYKPVRIEKYDTDSGNYYTFATLEYNSATGWLSKKTDANGSITLYTWSPLGVTSITENSQEPAANRQTWTFTYYKHNLPATVTDPSGRTIYYTYDACDRLISATNANGEKVEEYYYNTITE